LVRRAANLRLTASTLADSLRSGTFRSRYRSQGIEFSGVREYLHGDDVRGIDWNVTARMGKPYVKLFEEERELAVFLVVDCSASMMTGAVYGERQLCALESAALLALAAEQCGSPVGAVLFDGAIRFSAAPKLGNDHVMLLVTRFEEVAAADHEPSSGRGTVLDIALTGAARLLRKQTLIFIISDFRQSGWETPLAVLTAKHDIVALRVLDNFDVDIPPLGLMPFIDPENGIKQRLPTMQPAFRRAWQEAHKLRVQKWMSDCTRHGAFPLLLPVGGDPVRVLANFFASRSRA
jgi:uncharacterized protein (DUF58 family)